MTTRNSQTYDNLLVLKDATASVASGAAQVGGAARVLDMGLADMGNVKAVVDTGTVSGTSPTQTVAIQGSVDLAFTTPVQIGAGAQQTASGRQEIAIRNNQAGVLYRYIRAFVTIGGTTPSFSSVIYLAKD